MPLLQDHFGLVKSSASSDASPERTLREQQALLDNAGVGIVFLRQRLVVRCNQRYADIFGYDSDQSLVGERSDAFHPDRAAFRELGRSAYPVLSTGKPYRSERLMRRRCGS